MSSPYALGEVMRNLGKFPAAATAEWVRLRQQLKIVDDVVSSDQPAIFFASKDRPILLTALAWSDALITLDRDDFAKFLGSQFMVCACDYRSTSLTRSGGKVA